MLLSEYDFEWASMMLVDASNELPISPASGKGWTHSLMAELYECKEEQWVQENYRTDTPASWSYWSTIQRGNIKGNVMQSVGEPSK